MKRSGIRDDRGKDFPGFRCASSGLRDFTLRADPVHIQAVVRQLIAQASGNIPLMLLYDLIDKFINPAAFHTEDMVMMVTLVQLEHRVPPLEMMACDQAGRFKLGQHPVNRCQANVFSRFQQYFIDVLRAMMTRVTALEDIEDLHPGQGYFQAGLA